MELRRDLEFSEPLYSENKRGLLTLGTKEVIELENGKTIELLPYLIEMHYTRGISRNDPRIRRRNDKAIHLLAEAYANHYNNAGIDEHWTKEEVEEMMHWHEGQSLGGLFFVKWAKDIDSGEEFPVGFISAYSKPYQSGKILWDGELFVLPEYQRYGIGSELTKVLLLTAQGRGINSMEGLTYADENGHPLEMWKRYGATPTDLVHISADVSDMLSKMDKAIKGRSKCKKN